MLVVLGKGWMTSLVRQSLCVCVSPSLLENDGIGDDVTVPLALTVEDADVDDDVESSWTLLIIR